MWNGEMAATGAATWLFMTPRPPTPSMRGLDDMVLGAVMAVEVAVLQFRNLFVTLQPPHGNLLTKKLFSCLFQFT